MHFRNGVRCIPGRARAQPRPIAAAPYPGLAIIVGGTTLPDMRGRGRMYLNQGTGRITAGGGGVDGNTLFAAGGNEFLQAHTHANSLSDPGHSHSFNADAANGLTGASYTNGGNQA